MIEDFQGERRAASLILGPLSASEHRAFLETLVGAGHRRQPRQAAVQGQRRQSVLHEGTGARAGRFRRHHQGRQRRVESLRGGQPRLRRAAGHDSEGRREAHRAAAGRSARRPLGGLGDRHQLRRARPGGAGPGARRGRCDRSAGRRGADRGGARVARRPPELLERRRARRALRRAVARASAGRSIAAAAELLETRHAGTTRARAAAARPALLPGRRPGQDRRVCAAPGEDTRSRPSASRTPSDPQRPR